MSKFSKGHKQKTCYADGGKVQHPYGKPTFGRSVLAKVGIGDGYGNPKNAPKDKRLSISNAKTALPDAISKRKKMLDDV
jgi:hypothetical protein